ncbi:chemerin-like receptor 1 [Carettochelys insculpta]|uniref:chemerin-like receptor 1 n=1 Tax=Carettochelys insculpta TaxID=44489 RepID=UPI003EC0DDD4
MTLEEATHLHGVAPLEMKHLALIVLCTVALLLGVSGNGFIIFITSCQTKKTVDAVGHLNMAIAGFIFTVFLPLMVAQVALGVGWYLRNFLCRITNIITSLSMFSSSFLLTAISLDRCLSTTCPSWAQNHRTVHLASLVTLGVWILAVMGTWHYHGLCSNWSIFLMESGEAANVATRFLIGFLAPLALISICLVLLAAKWGQNQAAWCTKPLQTLLALHVIFFCCWFPYHVIAFLQVSPSASSPETTQTVETGAIFAHGLLCFNSCFYPFFCLLTQEHFAGCWRWR